MAEVEGAHLDLLDYRRRVQAIYAEVRARRAADPEGAHGLWRAARDELFAGHPQSALAPERRASFGGLRYFPYDPAVVFETAIESDVAAEARPLPISTGHALAFRRIGWASLPIGRLAVFWIEDYAGGVFVPFRDATAGEATYGGGRYLLDTAKGADLGSTPDGRLVLDFNFAYHPSCHYDARWSCPLAPSENHLAAAIGAGEQVYH